MHTARIAISRAEDKKDRCCTHLALGHVSGPVTFNEIFVQDGKVLGVPDTEKFADVRANGVPTGISYLMTAAANLAAGRCF